jgi:hypothetical protein
LDTFSGVNQNLLNPLEASLLKRVEESEAAAEVEWNKLENGTIADYKNLFKAQMKLRIPSKNYEFKKI